MLIYGILLAVISAVTFILYGADKGRAKRGAWRIPEKVLLGFSFFGGAPGGLLGMLAFRHKTRHWYFWAINLLGIAWQAALFGALAYFGV
ncbi:MAG TPA: DUF1294 domain-containing protein [Candidatus Borkfalkia excrementipullorum]|nr:DUF1294 domain-containing protein [Candidatus Borkfalkia excrementipullorum]